MSIRIELAPKDGRFVLVLGYDTLEEALEVYQTREVWERMTSGRVIGADVPAQAELDLYTHGGAWAPEGE